MRRERSDSADELEILPVAAEDLAAQMGERISRLRQQRGWSRVELASRLGVRRDRLAKWELGKSLPPVEMLAALRHALGASIDELVTGEPTVQGRLTPKQYEDLTLLVEAVRKVLREPGSFSLPGEDARSPGVMEAPGVAKGEAV